MPSKQLNKATGDLGEQIAARFMRNHGHSVLERNYWRKWGEIDLVTRKTVEIEEEYYPVVHFIEVKTVSHETKYDLNQAVTHGTWRPEEQVHERKLHQIYKAIETWLSEHEYEGEWQIDVAAVRMVPREKYAEVNHIENVMAQ